VKNPHFFLSWYPQLSGRLHPAKSSYSVVGFYHAEDGYHILGVILLLSIAPAFIVVISNVANPMAGSEVNLVPRQG
jgi:hypothetical protein